MNAILATASPLEDHRADDRPALTVSVVTATRPRLLAKAFSLDAEGHLVKASVADMAAGSIERREVPDLPAFAALLDGLEPAQALVYGLPHARGHALQRSPVTTQADPDGSLAAGAAIARTNDFLRWERRPGVLMLDHDEPPPGQPVPDPEQLRAWLIEAAPVLAEAPMLWRPSASSFLFDRDGRELQGLRGQRLYLPVADATKIEAAGRALVARLWAAGLGWIKVGAAGQTLPRTIVDASVWQRSRLDFAAPPRLSDGLQRRPPAPILWNEGAPWLDTDRLEADDEILRTADRARKQATEAARPEAAQAREAWIEAHAPRLAARRKIELDAARAVLASAAARRVLLGDFELVTQEGETVTVAEILDAPVKWHLKRFADPLEPEYGDDPRIAVARLRGGGPPTIYSHAHGGRTFRLERAQSRLQLARGQQPRVLDAVLEVTRLQGELFDFGGDRTAGMARVVGDRAVPADPEWLTDHLGRAFSFYSLRKLGERTYEADEDVPAWLPRRLIAKQGERDLPRLTAVITAPTMLADGSILDAPGHDPRSGLLYVCDDASPPAVPRDPSAEDAVRALATLWEPVRMFPFVDAVDRGVMLAAMLTACVRASLPTAPGFAFDAPTAGSGKTKLARLLGVLATGDDPAVLAPPGGREPDEETRKLLYTALLEGRRVVLLDNVNAPLGGAALDAFLTSSVFSGRTLGKSEMTALPNRALFLATGNNLRLLGDTCRRVLTARVDPQVETPWARTFDFDPVDWVAAERPAFVVAALTILRAAHLALGPGRGQFGSFETWDVLVRRAVGWVADQALGTGLPTFGDPLGTVERAFAHDPETGKLSALMDAWDEAFGDIPTTTAKVIKVAMGTGFQGEEPSALRDAIEEIAAQGSTINRRVLGRYIERHCGRRLAGRWFERGTLRNGAPTWVLRRSRD